MTARHDVAIVGAGHAGLAVSYRLAAAGIDHVVLDRGEIANAWANERWDSFCLVTPNWSLTLPGATYSGDDPGGFMLRDAFVTYIRGWAASFSAPVLTGVEVRKLAGEAGAFKLDTSAGPVEAKAVVVATATYHKTKPLPLRSKLAPRLHQLTATDYCNPAKLPDGAVLVVGSGQTGCQIAEELLEAGREVYLAVGRAGRLPRRYRGKDCIEWQRDMGWLDRTPQFLERPELRFRGDPHLSGKNGGHTISLHRFHAAGMRLIGHIINGEGEDLALAEDLADGLRFADDYALSFYQSVDNHIGENGIAAPGSSIEELAGAPPMQGRAAAAPTKLDLADCRISCVIWATGFTYDFSWVRFPIFDAMGYPVTEHGATAIRGLYFMGLNWMTKRKSGILYGAAEDSEHVFRHLSATLHRETSPSGA